MSYYIVNPSFHKIVGYFSKKTLKYHGYAIRECDQFDKDEFGCEFRAVSPYEPEYRLNEDNEVQHNPMHWTRPARRYGVVNGSEVKYVGIEIYESDENEENGKWQKLRGDLQMKGENYYSQDKPLKS